MSADPICHSLFMCGAMPGRLSWNHLHRASCFAQGSLMKRPTIRVTKWLGDIPVEAGPGVVLRAKGSSHRPNAKSFRNLFRRSLTSTVRPCTRRNNGRQEVPRTSSALAGYRLLFRARSKRSCPTISLSISPIHSSRSSIKGFTDSARCAGIHVASSPSNDIARTTPDRTSGSRGVA